MITLLSRKGKLRMVLMLLASLVWAWSSFGELKAQGNLGVDIGDPVYSLLDSASMRGYVTDLSQYRPYSAKQVYRYLEKMSENSRLSPAEAKVLQRELERFRGIAEPAGSDANFMDFLKDGTVLLSEDKNFPLAFRTMLVLNNRLDLVSKNPYLFDVMRLYLEGDITSYFSYQFMAGTGLTLAKGNSFAATAFESETDGHAISGGNIQNGEVTFSGEKLSIALQVGGKMAASFFDGKVRTSFGYMKRNMGFGNTSLLYSGNASPLLGWDLALRPVKWAGLNFLVGGLNGTDDDSSTSKAMFTAQQVEFFLTQYFYIGVTMASVWIKRLEPYYMMPFLPVAMGQSLLGDYDNLAMQGTMALKLPYVTIYGVGFTDEVQPSDAANLFSSLTQQFAFQAGVKVLLPKIPFTTFQFQYTKIEPYTYSHYAQRAFQGSAKTYGTINISWMNNERNLGYHLQPNSDEFLVRLESQAISGWYFGLGYQHIRHGDGDRSKGQVEGRSNSVFLNTVNKIHTYGGGVTTTSSGSTSEDQIYTGIYSGAAWYFNKDEKKGEAKRPKKDFLNDGVYEFIHIVTLDVAYRFRRAPIEIIGQFVFSYNDGPVYNGVKGAEEIRLGIGADIRFFGKSRR